MLRLLMILFLVLCSATPAIAAKHAQATAAPAPAKLSGEYHLACNLKPTTAPEVAKDAWSRVSPF